MLRIGMRALQRAAALQLQQGACSASSAGSGLLSALAAAMQRLQGPQHTSWASSQHNGSRQFAAAVGGGGASSGGGGSSGGREDALMSPMLASESGRLQFSDPDEALEAWGKAMDEGARPVVALRAAASRRRRMRRRRRRCVHALPPLPPTVPLLLLLVPTPPAAAAGDWGTAWDIFEGIAPVEDEGGPDGGGGEFPVLEELLAMDPDAEAKELRRQREREIRVRPCVHVCVRGGWWIPGRVDPVGAGRRLLLYRRMYHRLPTALSGGAPP